MESAEDKAGKPILRRAKARQGRECDEGGTKWELRRSK